MVVKKFKGEGKGIRPNTMYVNFNIDHWYHTLMLWPFTGHLEKNALYTLALLYTKKEQHLKSKVSIFCIITQYQR